MKKYFITGLVILLPLTLTIWIVTFAVNFLTKPFMGVVTKIFSDTAIRLHPQFLRYGSQVIILIALFILTLILGLVARWFMFNSLIKLGDKILHKIPLINKVYKTTQDIVKTLFITDKNSFKQVVMVPFPYKGLYSIGFVSRKAPDVCIDASNNDELISVFIPTTPNPTTGFILLFKKEDAVFLDITPEEGLKYIVSCGVILPPSKKLEK